MKPNQMPPIIVEESLSISLDDPYALCCHIETEIEAVTPMITPMSDNDSINMSPLSLINDSTTASSIMSQYTYTDDDINDVDFTQLLLDLFHVNEDILLANHGYIKREKICNTLQGELFAADVINNSKKRVAIKKTDKSLHEKRITVENGMNFIVDENIMKEASILHYLTTKNHKYIVKYIDFFESENYFYFVMEYVKDATTLKDFIIKCHQYISQRKLSLKKYKKIIKHIFYQLSQCLHFLHNSMNCAHMDICSENILLSNAQFKMNKNGKVHFKKNICIKLVDFGNAELFSDRTFKCNKYALSIENEQYLSPNITTEYDARMVDIWGLGIMFYESLIGSKPFQMIPEHITQTDGYWAVYEQQMEMYLKMNNLFQYANKIDGSLQLLIGLLKINEAERFDSSQILNSTYFLNNTYFVNSIQNINK